MVAVRHRRSSSVCFLVAAVAFTAAFISHTAVAEEADAPAATWYVVGGPDPDQGDRLTLDSGARHLDVGLTIARSASTDALTFTTGRSPAEIDRDGYTFLVSGVYDFRTGTMVTPRIVAGVGLSYFEAGSSSQLVATDPTAKDAMAPAFHLGFGADFDIGDNWAVSAEYSAFYLGESERSGGLGQSQLDQKFTVGAKVRF